MVSDRPHFENMGNSCVAGGWLAYPHRADVVIANHTKYELILDLDESCGRECNHKGELLISKIVCPCVKHGA